MKTKFVIREEPFGYTFFDKDTLRFQFLLKNELKEFLKKRKISSGDYEYLSMPRKDYRQDIIYSPIRIYYELTLACNIRCRHCFNSSGERRSGELTTQEVFASLENFKRNNVIDIRFTGGEATCRPDWFEILKKAKELGFAISLNTNGVYSSTSIYDKLAGLDLEQVTISVDGNKESHERNRGAGTFDKTINSLKELHRRGVRLRINTLVDNKSVNDLEFMADLASQYALEINFFIVRFMGRGLNLEGTDSVTMEQFYEMAKQAEKIRQKYPKLNLLHFAQVTRERSINSGTHDKFGLKIGPPPGFSNFNVTYDGGLWAGGYTPYIDPSQRCGNIKNDDLFNVWQHSDTLEEYRDVARKLMLFCQKCPELGNKCSGPNYEIELYRLFNRKSENPYCLYGQGPSLLTKLK